MPKILSFGKSGRSHKESIVISTWSRFNSLDLFVRASIVTMLLITLATSFIIGELMNLSQQAATGTPTATINVSPASGTYDI